MLTGRGTLLKRAGATSSGPLSCFITPLPRVTREVSRLHQMLRLRIGAPDPWVLEDVMRRFSLECVSQRVMP